jgi:membrane protease subunit HflK
MRNKLTITIPSILLLIYILSGFYTVQPEEIGIVRLFGKIIDNRVQPGIHYALPWPFQQVDKPKITEIKRISVGLRLIDGKKGVDSSAAETQMITGDTNIINVQMTLQYTIEDPVKFLFRAEDPQLFLSRAAEAELTRIIASMPVDEILTTGKIKIQNETRIGTQKHIDAYDTGIRIVAANLQAIVPPPDVIQAFQEVSSAKQDRERIINEAYSYTNDILPRARGEAEEITKKAESYKFERVNSAKGDTDRFLNILTEYKKEKNTTETKMYLETMEKILPRIKKYIMESRKNGDTSTLRFMFSE